jgi:feruloyl esterase
MTLREGVRTAALCAGAAAGALSLAGCWPQADANTVDGAKCAAMADFAGYGLKVEKAELVPAGPPPVIEGDGAPGPEGAELPAHCLVQGTINSRTGVGGREFGIGFDLRMPADWNGRFAVQGGGGMDGVLRAALGDIFGTVEPSALERGFAVITTDGGHSGPMTDSSFGLDQQARIDYAYNALEKTTLAGKEMVARYYGRPAEYSYMLGCSNGGRQGLVASQRMPLLFDGIVSGDPSIRFSRIAIDEMWNLQVVARIAPKDAQGRPIYSRAFSDADLNLVKTAVLKQCDAKDGLADGLIHDWQGCDFDPGILTCKGGKNDSCLSAPQVDALRDLHRGPQTSDGTSIYGPFNYDTGIAAPSWRGMRLGTSTTGEANSADATLGYGQFRFYQLTPPEPDFDPLKTVNYDEILERVRHTAAMGDGDSPFLSTFASHGKMIVYNGLSDQGMASSELADWYDEVVQTNGEDVKDSVRLFLVPGMLHCSGGDATDKFDMLTAIVDWVEKGNAPDRIVATSRSIPNISRPLCPHPKVARYKGGDTNSAESFQCTE